MTDDTPFSTDDALFSVHQFFPDGANECIAENVNAQEAADKAIDYANRPAAVIGVIQRIIITDPEDLIVFEWQHGKGVTFPPGNEGRELRPRKH